MIGIWNGPTLFAICHVQPLDQALSALCNPLDQAGKSQAPVVAFQQSETAQNKVKTSLRRLAAAMLASLAGFIRPIR
ncbi:MAG TPA: hypothetical protein VFK06_21820 [Candidatus Angelobacter sp.]|nr:hypothetical protein [Candidatus Angelobacter sp.]